MSEPSSKELLFAVDSLLISAETHNCQSAGNKRMGLYHTPSFQGSGIFAEEGVGVKKKSMI